MVFTRITVSLDGSPLAQGIVPTVSGLAEKLHSGIHLLAVVDPVATELPAFWPPPKSASDRSGLSAATLEKTARPELDAERKRLAGEYLEWVANDIQAEGVDTQTEVVAGDPAEEIVAAARRNHSDLICMATRGRSAIGRAFLGSVTDRVLHSCEIPMLIIRPRDGRNGAPVPAPVETVVVGLDGSGFAESALEYGIRLASQIPARLVLLRATAAAVRTSAWVEETIFPAHDFIQSLGEQARHYLERMAERAASAGIEPEIHVGPQTAPAELVGAAARYPSPLMVLATRGRSGLSRWVLGSVTDRVVRSVDRPVLIVPPPLHH